MKLEKKSFYSRILPLAFISGLLVKIDWLAPNSRFFSLKVRVVLILVACLAFFLDEMITKIMPKKEGEDDGEREVILDGTENRYIRTPAQLMTALFVAVFVFVLTLVVFRMFFVPFWLSNIPTSIG